MHFGAARCAHLMDGCYSSTGTSSAGGSSSSSSSSNDGSGSSRSSTTTTTTGKRGVGRERRPVSASHECHCFIKRNSRGDGTKKRWMRQQRVVPLPALLACLATPRCGVLACTVIYRVVQAVLMFSSSCVVLVLCSALCALCCRRIVLYLLC